MTAARTVGAIVVGMLALAGCSNEEPYALPSDITPVSETPAAPASPTTDKNQDGGKEFNEAETAAIENAKKAVTRFYEVQDAALAAPGDAGAKPFSNVAIDPVRSERRGVVGYALQEGWHQTGKTTVTFAEVRAVKTKSDPKKFVYPTVVFDICVDESDVDVLDKSGNSVQEEKPGAPSPAIIGTYEEPGDGWFVEYLEWSDDEAATKACDL